MGKKIVFASTNQGKLDEIRSLLPSTFDILSPSDIDFKDEIEETGKTFEENAVIKANKIFEFSGINCFADDSGLEIEALNNAPGVSSARYAGEPSNSKKNIEKVLKKMKDVSNRKARFITVICLKTANKTLLFTGQVSGQISKSEKGEYGFGYDSIFIPDGYNKHFAEMTSIEKNLISHRKKAIEKMLPYLDFL